MLAWVGVAVTVLASPAGRQVTHALPGDVLSPSLVRLAREPTTAERVDGWLSTLAVVRKGSRSGASMVVYVAVGPVGRHSMGFQAIGSF